MFLGTVRRKLWRDQKPALSTRPQQLQQARCLALRGGPALRSAVADQRGARACNHRARRRVTAQLCTHHSHSVLRRAGIDATVYGNAAVGADGAGAARTAGKAPGADDALCRHDDGPALRHDAHLLRERGAARRPRVHVGCVRRRREVRAARRTRSDARHWDRRARGESRGVRRGAGRGNPCRNKSLHELTAKSRRTRRFGTEAAAVKFDFCTGGAVGVRDERVEHVPRIGRLL